MNPLGNGGKENLPFKKNQAQGESAICNDRLNSE